MTIKPVYSWRLTCDHAGNDGLCRVGVTLVAHHVHEARNAARNAYGWQYQPPDIDLCSTHARKD